MKVLIVHFRSAPASGVQGRRVGVDPLDSAGTDGVSLEITKRQNLLVEMGQEVAICSAYDWADFPVPALEFDREEVMVMVRNLFGTAPVGFVDEADLRNNFDVSRVQLKGQFGKVIEDFAPDLIFVHNMFCLPIHPVATLSLTEILRERLVPCAAIHHDVLSEGAYKFTPTCRFAQSVLEEYYPPQMPNLRHWTINTRNKRALADRGVDADVIHDTMDFDHKLSAKESVRIRTLLRAKYGIKASDVVLFVGARIVPNKQTELAGRLASALQSLCREMTGQKLYHGEVFSNTNRVVLVLAGRPERAFVDYQKRLFKLFGTLNIEWRYVGDIVRPYRSEDKGLYALYPDLYAMADFVLYPTGWEGFGNQLLEAFAAELPVAVFEYPVFQEDIAPKGVKVVSLGDKLLSEKDDTGLVEIPVEALMQAAREIMRVLTHKEEFRSITGHNTAVGKTCFSLDVLRDHLSSAIDWAGALNPAGMSGNDR